MSPVHGDPEEQTETDAPAETPVETDLVVGAAATELDEDATGTTTGTEMLIAAWISIEAEELVEDGAATETEEEDEEVVGATETELDEEVVLGITTEEVDDVVGATELDGAATELDDAATELDGAATELDGAATELDDGDSLNAPPSETELEAAATDLDKVEAAASTLLTAAEVGPAGTQTVVVISTT
jgi:hypothetical protein